MMLVSDKYFDAFASAYEDFFGAQWGSFGARSAIGIFEKSELSAQSAMEGFVGSVLPLAGKRPPLFIVQGVSRKGSDLKSL